jgi:diaminohydroxyphosphoribosylaminopyrimidine deaminase/5-amino-6-(5-phosphoribosylamino)uracil reductase
MDAIVDWDRNAPQWPAVLAAARGGAVTPALRASPLWQVYGPLLRDAAHPYVVGQIGQSLDGRIATASGHSHYINGPAALLHLHRLRALVDAVVVGVGTVIADDPQLTVRHVDGPHPARVVVDPNGRLPAAAKCLRDDGVRRVVVQAKTRAWGGGVETLNIESVAGGMSPREILRALGGLGFKRILVEGGANTLSRFLDANCIDRLHVLMAPLIIGAGPTGINLPAIATLDDARRPRVAAFPFPGGDVLFDCEIK